MRMLAAQRTLFFNRVQAKLILQVIEPEARHGDMPRSPSRAEGARLDLSEDLSRQGIPRKVTQY
jgi:hypothetical protein